MEESWGTELLIFSPAKLVLKGMTFTTNFTFAIPEPWLHRS
jgi:hypothetical protein